MSERPVSVPLSSRVRNRLRKAKGKYTYNQYITMLLREANKCQT